MRSVYRCTMISLYPFLFLVLTLYMNCESIRLIQLSLFSPYWFDTMNPLDQPLQSVHDLGNTYCHLLGPKLCTDWSQAPPLGGNSRKCTVKIYDLGLPLQNMISLSYLCDILTSIRKISIDIFEQSLQWQNVMSTRYLSKIQIVLQL